MRQRIIFTAILVLFCGSVMQGCSGKKNFYSTWVSSYRPLNARFHRVSIFTDFTYMRNLKRGKEAILIEDSIKTAGKIDAQLVETFQDLNYQVPSHEKLFIGTYLKSKMDVADNRSEKKAHTVDPPIHVDPDVSSFKAYENAALEALRTFAQIATGGKAKMDNTALPQQTARILSSKSNSDAIVIAIGFSRKKAQVEPVDGPITESHLYDLKLPVLCIGVFHGLNGKLLWYGQKTFSNGMTDSGYTSAVKSLLSDFPEKGKGPYFTSTE